MTNDLLTHNKSKVRFFTPLRMTMHNRLLAKNEFQRGSEAIESVYPETNVQLCVVHIVRNSLRFVPWKDKKEVVADLKTIYTAINAEESKKT